MLLMEPSVVEPSTGVASCLLWIAPAAQVLVGRAGSCVRRLDSTGGQRQLSPETRPLDRPLCVRRSFDGPGGLHQEVLSSIVVAALVCSAASIRRPAGNGPAGTSPTAGHPRSGNGGCRSRPTPRLPQLPGSARTGRLRRTAQVPHAAVGPGRRAIRRGTTTCAIPANRRHRPQIARRQLHHCDFYLCHFLIRDDPQAPDGFELALIDFLRLKHSTRPRWRIKDLAQLLFSTDMPGITRTDRLRFWKHYLRSRAARCSIAPAIAQSHGQGQPLSTA